MSSNLLAVPKQAKYKVICEKLRSQILCGELPVGSKLPSQSALVKTYGVSLLTVRQSIDSLVKSDLVQPEHGRGVFVKAVNGKHLLKKTVKVVLCGEDITLAANNEFLRGVTDNGRLRDVEIKLEMLSEHELKQDGVLAKAVVGANGAILAGVVYPSYFKNIPSDVNIVLAVFPIEEDSHLNISSIVPDSESAGYLAAQQLHCFKHRGVALVVGDTAYYWLVRRGFERACFEYNMATPKVFVIKCPSDEQETARKIADDPSIGGIVVVGDQRSCRLIDFLARHNCRVPDSKSVLSIGGLPRKILSIPNIARINANIRQLGHEAVNVALDSSGLIIKKLLPPSIESGGTVAVASKN